METKFISTKDASDKWGISPRRVRALCERGKIDGAVLIGKGWGIPSDAKRPIDGRFRELTLAELYSKCQAKKAELAALRPLTDSETKRLNDEFTVEYTYNSTAIEGNTLTLRETELVLRGITIDRKPLKDHLETVNHRDAFYFMLSLVKNKEPLSERVVKELHSIVLNDRLDARGLYRNAAVRILGATHIPPNPLKIPSLIAALLAEYNADNDANIIKKVAEFHVKFENIHPFIDGNGRTGRLIANLELMKAGYPPVDIKFADRKEYYDAFEAYSLTRSFDKAERLFARYVLEELERYIGVVKF
ncbi:MAG: Fic family protein [Clostridiales bacterium]|jgi:Fic family protein|nr:Fic family protein [Clostridiales bacterium]